MQKEELKPRCSVIGLGKLGSPLAAVLAKTGFQTIGVDVNQAFVDAINSGKAPVFEPQLQDYINDAKGNIQATMNYREAILETNVTFVIVPTPSNEQGIFSNDYIIQALRKVGEAITEKDDYHLVNITSTVMPGSMDGEIKTTLEQASGRTVGENLGLCYNPEFIALGQVIKDMLNPDFILIGESDPKAGQIISDIYSAVCSKPPTFQRMNFVNAELTKISVNTYITTKITYANMLSDVCERLPGADVDVVTTAMGIDARIGGKYLKGRLGYAGPCFPRDNVAFGKLAQRVGANCTLVEATDTVNHYQVERLFTSVSKHLSPNAKVGVLGIAYKPNSVVTEASQSLALSNQLADNGYQVQIYDPLVKINNVAAIQSPLIEQTESPEACFYDVDCLIIATEYPEFSNLNFLNRKDPNKELVIFDCWRQLKAKAFKAPIEIIHLGKNRQRQE